MNTNTVAGKIDQIAGKIKQTVGEAVGNESLANRGAAEQVKGHFNEAWGDVKETASDLHQQAHTQTQAKLHSNSEELKSESHDTTHDLREKITSTAQNVKENITTKLDELKHKHNA